MKNKFFKTIATMLLVLTFLSNWALDAGRALLPGASTYGAPDVVADADDDDFYGYLPYKW